MFLKDFDKNKSHWAIKVKKIYRCKEKDKNIFPKVKVPNGKLTVRLGFFFFCVFGIMVTTEEA